MTISQPTIKRREPLLDLATKERVMSLNDQRRADIAMPLGHHSGDPPEQVRLLPVHVLSQEVDVAQCDGDGGISRVGVTAKRFFESLEQHQALLAQRPVFVADTTHAAAQVGANGPKFRVEFVFPGVVHAIRGLQMVSLEYYAVCPWGLRTCKA